MADRGLNMSKSQWEGNVSTTNPRYGRLILCDSRGDTFRGNNEILRTQCLSV